MGFLGSEPKQATMPDLLQISANKALQEKRELVERLRAEADRFRKADMERQQLIDLLLKLSEESEALQQDLEREREYNRKAQRILATVGTQPAPTAAAAGIPTAPTGPSALVIADWRKGLLKRKKHAYVAVNANDLFFHKNLIIRLETGGLQVVNTMESAIMKHISESGCDYPNMLSVWRIYVNPAILVTQLANRYPDTQITVKDIEAFFFAFTRYRILTQVIYHNDPDPEHQLLQDFAHHTSVSDCIYAFLPVKYASELETDRRISYIDGSRIVDLDISLPPRRIIQFRTLCCYDRWKEPLPTAYNPAPSWNDNSLLNDTGDAPFSAAEKASKPVKHLVLPPVQDLLTESPLQSEYGDKDNNDHELESETVQYVSNHSGSVQHQTPPTGPPATLLEDKNSNPSRADSLLTTEKLTTNSEPTATDDYTSEDERDIDDDDDDNDAFANGVPFVSTPHHISIESVPAQSQDPEEQAIRGKLVQAESTTRRPSINFSDMGGSDAISKASLNWDDVGTATDGAGHVPKHGYRTDPHDATSESIPDTDDEFYGKGTDTDTEDEDEYDPNDIILKNSAAVGADPDQTTILFEDTNGPSQKSETAQVRLEGRRPSKTGAHVPEPGSGSEAESLKAPRPETHLPGKVDLLTKRAEEEAAEARNTSYEPFIKADQHLADIQDEKIRRKLTEGRDSDERQLETRSEEYDPIKETVRPSSPSWSSSDGEEEKDVSDAESFVGRLSAFYRHPPPPVVNRLGHRLDRYLPHPAPSILEHVRALKLCNSHFLSGNCPGAAQPASSQAAMDGARKNGHQYNLLAEVARESDGRDDSCPEYHVHDYTPSREELQALAVIARTLPCPVGPSCRDKRCFHGHHCMREAVGKVCHRIRCRFSYDAHGIDLMPLDEDGKPSPDGPLASMGKRSLAWDNIRRGTRLIARPTDKRDLSRLAGTTTSATAEFAPRVLTKVLARPKIKTASAQKESPASSSLGQSGRNSNGWW